MQEYKILVPTHDNDGRGVDLDALWARALALFGGYTLAPACEGVWCDKGDPEPTIYRDTVIPCYVATNDVEAARRFAGEVCRAARQICVYLRHPGGAVEFVEGTP